MKDRITMDFMSDWTEFCRSELTRLKCQFDKSVSDEEIRRMYRNLCERLVVPAPRTILKSAEFKCPDEYSRGLAQLEKNVTAGVELTAYMSRSITRPASKDTMLYMWGIHHFHLGEEMDSKHKGFIQGNDDILFAYVTDSHFYAINIYKHGDWSHRSILQTIYNNWPDVLEPCRLIGVSGDSEPRTDEEIALLWNAGVSTPFQSDDGVVFAPPGGGITTAKSSTNVVIQSDRMLFAIRDIEKYVTEHESDYFVFFTERGLGEQQPLKLELGFDSSGIFITSPDLKDVTIPVTIGT